MYIESSSHKKDSQKDQKHKRSGPEVAPPVKPFNISLAQGSDGKSGAWLISFTDVMALMLTFFVLLFSMSEPQTQTWQGVTAALQKEFNRFHGGELNKGMEDAISIDRVNMSSALDIDYLESILRQDIRKNPVLSSLIINKQTGGLVLSFPSDLLFASGRNDMSEEGEEILTVLSMSLNRIKNRIEITGHADPSPVSDGGSFVSNWDLSLSRAAKVAGALEGAGYRRNIIVRGHSDGRFFDLQKYISDEGRRMDLARRVDIFISESAEKSPVVSPDLIFD